VGTFPAQYIFEMFVVGRANVSRVERKGLIPWFGRSRSTTAHTEAADRAVRRCHRHSIVIKAAHPPVAE
jgi:hypothetical protein